jgi:hypothetical protein
VDTDLLRLCFYLEFIHTRLITLDHLLNLLSEYLNGMHMNVKIMIYNRKFGKIASETANIA